MNHAACLWREMKFHLRFLFWKYIENYGHRIGKSDLFALRAAAPQEPMFHITCQMTILNIYIAVSWKEGRVWGASSLLSDEQITVFTYARSPSCRLAEVMPLKKRSEELISGAAGHYS